MWNRHSHSTSKQETTCCHRPPSEAIASFRTPDCKASWELTSCSSPSMIFRELSISMPSACHTNPWNPHFHYWRVYSLMHETGYDITFHKLRHAFATTLNDLGIPSNYIQKLGGWSTDNVMKSVYTHTTTAKETEYQNKIDAFSCRHLETRIITRISHETENSTQVR